ncbi:MAG: hemolysin family protein [Oscillospiraceae bacterium]|nr:hemolysin family protein [Oscillospiraceae bacterium]
MDEGSRWLMILAVIMLFLAAFYAMAETAVSSASRIRIKTAADKGERGAENAQFILEHFDKAISTLLICINITHIVAASAVTVAVTRTWGLGAVTLSTILTTFVVFYFGEMLPKSIAKRRGEQILLAVSGNLTFTMKVLTPLSAFLSAIGGFAAKLSRNEAELSVTEDELYDIIEDMTEEGTLDEEQGDLISSALQFGDVTVESILTPRVDLTAINVEDSNEKILARIRSTNHSRLPVYEESIDHIIGILQIRTYIKAWLKEGSSLDIRPLLDEVMFVHQSTNIDELLPTMTRRKLNVAVVTDNYGGTLGIVSIEDILEELVGEIWDEDDVVEENVVQIASDAYRVDAEESVSDVFEQLEFEDPEDNEELVNTLMGEWAYRQFTTIPSVGDSFEYHDLKITVSEMDHNRILSLTVLDGRAAEEEAKA